MKNFKHPSLLVLGALILMLALAGCSESETSATIPAAAEQPATADKDAAEAVAADLGSEGGGLTDQIADMAWAMGAASGAKNGPGDGQGHRPNGSIERVYDDATGIWTITITRERGDSEGVPYAAMTRQYTMRFLDEAGEPMMHRIVDADTARTAEFAIVSGTGVHRNRRLVGRPRLRSLLVRPAPGLRRHHPRMRLRHRQELRVGHRLLRRPELPLSVVRYVSLP